MAVLRPALHAELLLRLDFHRDAGKALIVSIEMSRVCDSSRIFKSRSICFNCSSCSRWLLCFLRLEVQLGICDTGFQLQFSHIGLLVKLRFLEIALGANLGDLQSRILFLRLLL